MKRQHARSLPLYSKKRTDGFGGNCLCLGETKRGSVLLGADGARRQDNGGIHWPRETVRGYLEQHQLEEIPPCQVGPIMPRTTLWDLWL
jgi:hypothetical protein